MVKISIDEKPKEEPKKHRPGLGLDAVICLVCGKPLGSLEQDKPCPGETDG